MQNLHRHSSYSNLFSADSAALNEDYAKRAVELGHKVLSSVEHGWQGNYFQTYELAKKYNLKTMIGTEAYWVKDREKEYETVDKNGKIKTAKDRSNHHICIYCKSNQGREAMNDVLSEANISGYYFRPRLDIPLILSLPPKDVVITSACIAFSGYEDIDDIILQFYEHFGENFYLEQQYHNTDRQKEWGKHLVKLSEKHGIQMIVGLDSHYIYPKEAELRDYVLEAKGVHYDDEEGWFMDYPADDEVVKRFKKQGVLSDEQIKNAMNNTDIALDFCDYDNIRVFTKDIKLPSLYPNETKEQKDKRYSRLISKKFKEYMKNVPEGDYDKYFEGVKAEVQTYKDTGMCDYPLLDYAIVQDAIEHGGLITDTGRGSAVGYFTNTLCGFSKIDRFTSAIKLYPERFISTTRILETRSLPDLDLNVGTPEIFEESQRRIMGEGHSYPLIAFGTLKKKSAFKIYAKAKNMSFDLANTISNQMGDYDEAVKNAPDDEQDEIDIYDYVDKKYEEYIEQSKEYWGVISDKKKAPCAHLLYDGDIRKEIGLIKCKTDSTKKEYITCVIDGYVAENYKFLKNDILKVDIVLLVDMVFRRIGIKHFNVNELIKKVSVDQKVWDLYANGYTIGLNQVEREGSRKKCMNYKPKNVSELSAFVAAIRPGFKSMYKKFENREDFSWGIPTLDNMLRTEELPVSFLFFQEQVMSVLNYGGFPMDECYGIIKAIAKKHPEKVKPLKQKFIDGFREKLIEDENLSEEKAQENAEQVWTIIDDNCGYGFNCVVGSTKIYGCEYSIGEMYSLKHDKNYAEKNNALTIHEKYNKEGYGTGLSLFSDNHIRPNRIVGIKKVGLRQTYILQMQSGRFISCTDNHKFPTTRGEVELKHLKTNDVLFCKGDTIEYRETDAIYKIIPDGMKEVYDVEMDDPAHNFVIDNGLVTSNSAHAYCMALDSLYQAWQKAHYPYEFYEVLLQFYSDKGNKDKVVLLKEEMKKAFGIKEGLYRFRDDNRKFTADPENQRIIPSLASIKGISQTDADALYSLKDNKYDSFIDLLLDIKKVKVNSGKLDKLIKLNFFREFGKIGQLLYEKAVFDEYYKPLEDGKQAQFKFEKWPYDIDILKRNATKLTEKLAKVSDTIPLIKDIVTNTTAPKFSLKDQLEAEREFLGYLITTVPKLPEDNYYIFDCDIRQHGKGRTIRMKLYRLKTGETFEVKDRAKKQTVPKIGDFICTELYKDRKYVPTGKEDEKGNMTFSRSDEKEWIFDSYKFLGKKGN